MNDTPRQWNHNVVLRLLSREASILQETLAALKRQAAYSWSKAVPNTVKGENHFRRYSLRRASYLKYKRELKQVNACIKAIKRGE
jgi:hypothetical protein